MTEASGCIYAPIVADARAHCLVEAAREEEEFLGRVRCLEEAIENAAASRAMSLKSQRLVIHSHQRRIGANLLRVAATILQMAHRDIQSAADFDQLYEIVRRIELQPGLGALTTYDIAERIGWFRKLYPGWVYVHAGAEAGARRLNLKPIDRRIPKQSFPPSFQCLSAAQIETLLCLYKNDLAAPESFEPGPICGKGGKRQVCG